MPAHWTLSQAHSSGCLAVAVLGGERAASGNAFSNNSARDTASNGRVSTGPSPGGRPGMPARVPPGEPGLAGAFLGFQRCLGPEEAEERGVWVSGPSSSRGQREPLRAGMSPHLPSRLGGLLQASGMDSRSSASAQGQSLRTEQNATEKQVFSTHISFRLGTSGLSRGRRGMNKSTLNPPHSLLDRRFHVPRPCWLPGLWVFGIIFPWGCSSDVLGHHRASGIHLPASP